MGWEMPEHLAQPPLFRAFDRFVNGVGWQDRCAPLLADLNNLLAKSTGTGTAVAGGQPIGLANLLAAPQYGILKRDRKIADRWVSSLSPATKRQAIKCGILKKVPRTTPTVWELDEVEHLNKEWFTFKAPGNTCAWWSADSGPIEEMFIQALIDLLLLKQEKQVPVASYWLCAGRDGDPFKDKGSPGFRCYIGWTSTQITFLILTPEEPDARGRNHHAPATPPATGLGQQKANFTSRLHPDRQESGILVVRPDAARNPRNVVVRAYDLNAGTPI